MTITGWRSRRMPPRSRSTTASSTSTPSPCASRAPVRAPVRQAPTAFGELRADHGEPRTRVDAERSDEAIHGHGNHWRIRCTSRKAQRDGRLGIVPALARPGLVKRLGEGTVDTARECVVGNGTGLLHHGGEQRPRARRGFDIVRRDETREAVLRRIEVALGHLAHRTQVGALGFAGGESLGAIEVEREGRFPEARMVRGERRGRGRELERHARRAGAAREQSAPQKLTEHVEGPRALHEHFRLVAPQAGVGVARCGRGRAHVRR